MAAADPSAAADSIEDATPRYSQIIDKSLPRPGPTMEYSWQDFSPDATVLYIRSHEEANRHLAGLPNIPQAFGFDLEWKPTFVKGGGENPVAIVQLSNDQVIFLFQVSSMQEFPTRLAQLLANPLVVKAGVAIQSDARKLYNDYKVPMTNCIDLSLLARTVDNARWQGKYNSSLGLARLVETYDYRLLGKGKVTRSNWEANLSPLQIEYASNDAHAGYRLYTHLTALASAMFSTPDPVWFTFNYTQGQMLDSRGSTWSPRNPNYDPGPPLPPRPPRDEKNPGDRKPGNESRSRPPPQSDINVIYGFRPPKGNGPTARAPALPPLIHRRAPVVNNQLRGAYTQSVSAEFMGFQQRHSASNVLPNEEQGWRSGGNGSFREQRQWHAEDTSAPRTSTQDARRGGGPPSQRPGTQNDGRSNNAARPPRGPPYDANMRPRRDAADPARGDYVSGHSSGHRGSRQDTGGVSTSSRGGSRGAPSGDRWKADPPAQTWAADAPAQGSEAGPSVQRNHGKSPRRPSGARAWSQQHGSGSAPAQS